MTIQYLSPSLLPATQQAFQAAFADYEIAVNLDLPQFKKRFEDKLQVNFDASAVAVEGNQVVGFIFTNIAEYQGKLTAYNGGTGVIPSFRGKQLTQKMYEFLLPRFRELKVQQCLLEAITTNLKALHVYQKIGFKKTRLMRCYKYVPEHHQITESNKPEINIFEQKEPDWHLYKYFHDIEPSYLDQDALVKKNLKNEKVIEAVIHGGTIGYAVYQNENGRISQMAVHPDYRNQGIGTWLIKHIFQDSNKKLTILNIEDDYQPFHKFFKSRGFENEINQHEMVMNL